MSTLQTFKNKLFSGEAFYYQQLSFLSYKTYLLSALFVTGNILTPYLLHHFHIGGAVAGKVFLPLYFFVLIGTYKYGWKVGLITAIFSPLVSFSLIQMPAFPILPFVIMKGTFLAILGWFFIKKTGKLSFLNLFSIIVSYQLLGSIVIFLFTGNSNLVLADFIIGYPGLLIQLMGGYFFLKLINGYGK